MCEALILAVLPTIPNTSGHKVGGRTSSEPPTPPNIGVLNAEKILHLKVYNENEEFILVTLVNCSLLLSAKETPSLNFLFKSRQGSEKSPWTKSLHVLSKVKHK